MNSVTRGDSLSVLLVLDAPCAPPRQQIWTLWDPEQALSQHQHPPLSRRQTSGGQTLLPCNSPRCFPSHLMPSLLSFALPKPHLVFFCFECLSHSVVHPTKLTLLYILNVMVWNKGPKCLKIFSVRLLGVFLLHHAMTDFLSIHCVQKMTLTQNRANGVVLN